MQKFFDAELVRKIDGKIGSSELYQNYRDWCRRMGHTAVDDRQFKASMQRIDGVSWKRSNEGRFFLGLEYRELISNNAHGGDDILF